MVLLCLGRELYVFGRVGKLAVDAGEAGASLEAGADAARVDPDGVIVTEFEMLGDAGR